MLVACHTHPRLSQGGAEIAAYEQFRRASAEPGTEAWFLASNGAAHASRPGLVLSQPFGPSEWLHTGQAFDDFKLSNPDPAFARALPELLSALRPDTVHFHHLLGLGVEALLLARRTLPEARIVLTLHEYLLICNHFGQMVTRPDFHLCHMASPAKCHRCFPERDPRAFFLRELWLKRFLRVVDGFVSPSHFLKGRFVAWGLPAERIAVAENTLPPHPPVTPRVRAPGTALRVAFFGQLSPLKGVEVLLRAARRAQARALPITFRLYGTWQNQPDSFQARMRAALETLPDNVAFKGAYRNEEVVPLMARNDVVVVPSMWWENSPLTIQEARVAGCVVLGSDIGGVREKVLEAERGRLFEVGDADSLLETLVSLLPEQARGSPPLRRKAMIPSAFGTEP